MDRFNNKSLCLLLVHWELEFSIIITALSNCYCQPTNLLLILLIDDILWV